MTTPMNRLTDHQSSNYARQCAAPIETSRRLHTSHEEAVTRASEQAGASALAALPSATSPHRRVPNPLRGLMSAFGHTAECVEQSLGGTARGSGCACGYQLRSMDDPAVAVALALQFAKQRKRTGIPIPRPVVRLLAQRVDKGDGACLAVAQSLHRQGLLTSPGGISDALLALHHERRSLNAEGMQ